MTHFEPQRFWRAFLTCTTCKDVVAVGPPEPDAAMAAYRLGSDGGADALRHLGKCAGGAVVCTTEEEPEPVPQPSVVPSPSPAPAPASRRRRRRGPYQLTPARLISKGPPR